MPYVYMYFLHPNRQPTLPVRSKTLAKHIHNKIVFCQLTLHESIHVVVCMSISGVGTYNIYRWGWVLTQGAAVLVCVQGGEPDVNAVARIVLNDFQRGKLPYFVKPPSSKVQSFFCRPATTFLFM